MSKKCVCSGGKLLKSSQVLCHSDQGKYFLKINLNYFAHICPEYGFWVNDGLNVCFWLFDWWFRTMWNWRI